MTAYTKFDQRRADTIVRVQSISSIMHDHQRRRKAAGEPKFAEGQTVLTPYGKGVVAYSALYQNSWIVKVWVTNSYETRDGGVWKRRECIRFAEMELKAYSPVGEFWAEAFAAWIDMQRGGNGNE